MRLSAYVGFVAILVVAAISFSWAGSIPAQDADDYTANSVVTAPAVTPATTVSPAQPVVQTISRPVNQYRTVVYKTEVRPRVYKYTTKTVKVGLGTKGQKSLWDAPGGLHDSGVVSRSYIDARDAQIDAKANYAVNTAEDAKMLALRGTTAGNPPANGPEEGNNMAGGIIGWLAALALLVIAILGGMAISRLIARDANETRREMARDASADAHDSAETAMSRWNIRGVRVRRSGSFAADFFNPFGHAPTPAVAYAPVSAPAPAGGVTINNYNSSQPSGWHSPNAPQPAAGHVPVVQAAPAPATP